MKDLKLNPCSFCLVTLYTVTISRESGTLKWQAKCMLCKTKTKQCQTKEGMVLAWNESKNLIKSVK